MSSSRMEENLLETTEDHDSDGGDAAKLVRVTESIRYRKRAQSAEKKAEGLTEQLAQANEKLAQMSQDLSDLEVERTLVRKLVVAGATDLETAVLVAKARMEGKTETDVDGCVELLKKEKAYLFGGSSQTLTSRKTAGVKERAAHGGQTVLEQAAKRAARTGNRTDLQQYLKLRRNFL